MSGPSTRPGVVVRVDGSPSSTMVTGWGATARFVGRPTTSRPGRPVVPRPVTRRLTPFLHTGSAAAPPAASVVVLPGGRWCGGREPMRATGATITGSPISNDRLIQGLSSLMPEHRRAIASIGQGKSLAPVGISTTTRQQQGTEERS